MEITEAQYLEAQHVVRQYELARQQRRDAAEAAAHAKAFEAEQARKQAVEANREGERLAKVPAHVRLKSDVEIKRSRLVYCERQATKLRAEIERVMDEHRQRRKHLAPQTAAYLANIREVLIPAREAEAAKLKPEIAALEAELAAELEKKAAAENEAARQRAEAAEREKAHRRSLVEAEAARRARVAAAVASARPAAVP